MPLKYAHAHTARAEGGQNYFFFSYFTSHSSQLKFQQQQLHFVSTSFAFVSFLSLLSFVFFCNDFWYVPAPVPASVHVHVPAPVRTGRVSFRLRWPREHNERSVAHTLHNIFITVTETVTQSVSRPWQRLRALVFVNVRWRAGWATNCCRLCLCLCRVVDASRRRVGARVKLLARSSCCLLSGWRANGLCFRPTAARVELELWQQADWQAGRQHVREATAILNKWKSFRCAIN